MGLPLALKYYGDTHLSTHCDGKGAHAMIRSDLQSGEPFGSKAPANPKGAARPQFVFEPAIVNPGSIPVAGLASGAPACPTRFTWRGREYRVARVLETGRQLRAHDSDETYVRSHSFRVVTECGYEIVLRCDRQIRGNPWRVYTVRKL